MCQASEEQLASWKEKPAPQGVSSYLLILVAEYATLSGIFAIS